MGLFAYDVYGYAHEIEPKLESLPEARGLKRRVLCNEQEYQRLLARLNIEWQADMVDKLGVPRSDLLQKADSFQAFITACIRTATRYACMRNYTTCLRVFLSSYYFISTAAERGRSRGGEGRRIG